MKVSILGVDLELDIYDVDVYETYENAVREVDRKVNKSPDMAGMSTAERLRYQCSAVKEFFDTVFGPGTAESMFHGKNNIKDCTEAYLAVIKASGAELRSYSETMDQEFSKVSSKYAPEDDMGHVTNPIEFRNAVSSQNLNRAQRRNSGKKKRR